MLEEMTASAGLPDKVYTVLHCAELRLSTCLAGVTYMIFVIDDVSRCEQSAGQQAFDAP